MILLSSNFEPDPFFLSPTSFYIDPLFNIYQNTKVNGVAFTRLARWYEQVEQSRLKSFATVQRTIQIHYQSILNYFDNRSTNASTESFNAKIKVFRLHLRGITAAEFFLFRLQKLFA